MQESINTAPTTPNSQTTQPAGAEFLARGSVLYGRIGEILEANGAALGDGGARSVDPIFGYQFGEVPDGTRTITYHNIGGPTNNLNRSITTYELGHDGTLLGRTWTNENNEGQSSGKLDINSPDVVDSSLKSMKYILDKYDAYALAERGAGTPTETQARTVGRRVLRWLTRG